MRFVRTPILCLTLCVTALSACTSNADSLKVESLTETLARLAPATPLRPMNKVDEPSSYRIEFDRYVAGRTSDKVVRSGGKKRKGLIPSALVRNVVRPFNETGTINRRLGFVREAGSNNARVSLARPLPDDPRPRVYPSADTPTQQRVVAGRRCVVHVVGTTEFCVDAAGLVLETRDADALAIATKVTVGADVRSAAQLRAQLALGFINTDRGSIRPIDPNSAPAGATDYSLDNPPDGFTLVGRYAVVGLSQAVLDRKSRKVIAGIVDVYVNGIDSVIVERGGKLDTSAPDSGDLGALIDEHAVDLGATLGAGTAGIGGDDAYGYREVRALPSQGRYVVVAGTLPEDQLVTIAAALHPWPGGQITYLDHPVAGPKVPPTTVEPAGP